MRIVIDTNVIVSALVFGGAPRQVVELADSGRCEFFYSPATEDEVRSVLAGKFGWNEIKLNEVLPELWKMGRPIVPHHRVEAVREDPDDNRILECALSAHAAFVVSGDRHLLRLGAYRSIRVVTPRAFIETFLNAND